MLEQTFKYVWRWPKTVLHYNLYEKCTSCTDSVMPHSKQYAAIHSVNQTDKK